MKLFPLVFDMLDEGRFTMRKTAAKPLQSLRISGTIPDEIGELKHLSVLNVADNQISGNIPPSIVNLSGLMHLDLNNNRNTGQIPSSISYQELQNAFRDKELLGYNIMINVYATTGLHHKAEKLFRAMQRDGRSPDSFTYLALVRAYTVETIGAI
ncbi:hypothetical protein HHK36_032550 [Tetracentron sinense]|uniref:Pentatricopeptide repeat-containing protein n=1 Tax=Tetracentron sinense TaxID=13715 RepID=A0A835CZF8_TETSI|nr:hypothetical protein HHK36_032550 [Tetracentron sinense]